MTHPTSIKKLIRLLSVTIFASLLLVGAAGVTSAQAEVLDGLVKGVSFCDDGLGEGISDPKKKVIDIAGFNVDASGIPTLLVTVTLDGQVINMSGNALAKNVKSGVFQLFGDDGALTDLAMNGKYKLNNDGTLVAIAGAFQAQDLGDLCITIGKFKAKNNAL
jgi:hypothetical protein